MNSDGRVGSAARPVLAGRTAQGRGIRKGTARGGAGGRALRHAGRRCMQRVCRGHFGFGAGEGVGRLIKGQPLTSVSAFCGSLCATARLLRIAARAPCSLLCQVARLWSRQAATATPPSPSPPPTHTPVSPSRHAPCTVLFLLLVITFFPCPLASTAEQEQHISRHPIGRYRIQRIGLCCCVPYRMWVHIPA